ncbi:MAG: KEOPS complex subunit Pcc1 [Candidatus Micrarchaeota archaeon]
MKARCFIEMEFPDGDAAKAALKAVSHEGAIGNRSKAELSTKKNSLRVDISAEDIIALRASCNAFMRALQAFEDIERCRK